MAQLDNAADSDSEERGFKSLWAGQKKITHFCVVSFLFLHQEGFEPEMGANSEQSEERSDRETVQWTVSTFL